VTVGYNPLQLFCSRFVLVREYVLPFRFTAHTQSNNLLFALSPIFYLVSYVYTSHRQQTSKMFLHTGRLDVRIFPDNYVCCPRASLHTVGAGKLELKCLPMGFDTEQVKRNDSLSR